MASRKRRPDRPFFATFKDVPVDPHRLQNEYHQVGQDALRIPFRVRPAHETESVLVGEGSNAEMAQVRVNSVNSGTPTLVSFSNQTKCDVRLLWLDYRGNEVKYLRVKKGRTVRQATYETHPWIARDLATGERLCIDNSMVYFPNASNSRAAIVSIPPRIGWSPSVHFAFPPEVQEPARQLLLAAHVSPCRSTGLSTIASRLSSRPRTRHNARALEAAQQRVQQVAAPAPTEGPATRASKRRRREAQAGEHEELTASKRRRGAEEPVGAGSAHREHERRSSACRGEVATSPTPLPSCTESVRALDLRGMWAVQEGRAGLGDLPPGLVMSIAKEVAGDETILDVRPPPLPRYLHIKRASHGMQFLACVHGQGPLQDDMEQYFEEL